MAASTIVHLDSNSEAYEFFSSTSLPATVARERETAAACAASAGGGRGTLGGTVNVTPHPDAAGPRTPHGSQYISSTSPPSHSPVPPPSTPPPIYSSFPPPCPLTIEEAESKLLHDLTAVVTGDPRQDPPPPPSVTFERITAIGSLSPRQVCQHHFRKNDIVWVCKTCQSDETCVLCNACFNDSNHEGHDVIFYHAMAGGCCDCGDEDAWDPKGFCSRHGRKAIENNSSIGKQLIRNTYSVVTQTVTWLTQTGSLAKESFERSVSSGPVSLAHLGRSEGGIYIVLHASDCTSANDTLAALISFGIPSDKASDVIQKCKLAVVRCDAVRCAAARRGDAFWCGFWFDVRVFRQWLRCFSTSLPFSSSTSLPFLRLTIVLLLPFS